MKVTFDNVTIVVEAETPRAAHDLLGQTIAKAGGKIAYATDTFDTKGADGNFDNFRRTSELF